MSKKLVIVESPSKAKTIQKYLGNDYIIESSYGHVRDLPKKDISIDIENNFKPKYVVSNDKKEVVKKLKKLAKEVDEVLLATDEDREGEAISWHLCEILGLNPEDAKRITYTEVTKDAIVRAIQNPRKLNMGLVNAQQARRVLDRIVGYELSPVLWKKVKPSLSAGRVQSVAVRIIVEREREITNFTTENYFNVSAQFVVLDKKGNKSILYAKLPEKLQTEKEVEDFLEACKKGKFSIADIEKKPSFRNPSAPFITSTLQQEASRKLSFSVSKTMSVAQQLYEEGHITYMRTDSVTLSQTAISQAAAIIESNYGKEYVNTRQFTTKNKDAQEAHEAIRPTNFASDKAGTTSDQKRLYDLIWKRAIASQMAKAKLERTIVSVKADTTSKIFEAKGEVLLFDGFLKVYLEGKDDGDEEEEMDGILPPISVGQELGLKQIQGVERFTRPGARYTEASLVKKLEELGIGRPSTYAPTISTIQKRNYIEKTSREGEERKYRVLTLENDKISAKTETEITGAENNKLFPTDIGMVVNDFLIEHFKDIMDYDFTAQMEQSFDNIEEGKTKWSAMVSKFYKPFHDNVEKTLEEADRASGERILGTHPQNGRTVLVRVGRYGPMAQIGTPEDEEKPEFAKLLPTQSIETITLEEALELFKLPRDLGEFEGKVIKASIGRFGPYVLHNKVFVSIPKASGLDPNTINVQEAVELIKAKREADANKFIMAFEEEDIQVLNGRWGPYIKKGKQNFKIPKGVEAEKLTLEKVNEIIANQPQKKRGGRARKK
ncbi:MAG: type I DNA topoisomerase [Chitinophagales bacterium]|nr:type I DNA topoisomerase [Bacteroidota bacterium]MCB9225977.1 type I DNA topoisomerase [Chitinophagales bacterium]